MSVLKINFKHCCARFQLNGFALSFVPFSFIYVTSSQDKSNQKKRKSPHEILQVGFCCSYTVAFNVPKCFGYGY